MQVLEQYLTYDVDAPLQDRFAEGILLTILAEAPKVQADPRNYAARANLMWCATNGLNGAIGCGVPQDWASHAIGHELTALYGVDHGQSLALVMPLVMRHQRRRKRAKLLQYARRVWGLTAATRRPASTRPSPTRRPSSACWGPARGWPTAAFRPRPPRLVAARLGKRNLLFGEHHDLGSKEVQEIMELGMGA